MTTMVRSIPKQMEIERLALALDKCASIDEIKDVRDRAMAIQLYARKKESGMAAAQAAGRIVTLAMMRLAALYAEEKSTQGKNQHLDRNQDAPGKVAIAKAADMDPAALSRLGPIAGLTKKQTEPLMRAIEEKGEIASPGALMREAIAQGVIEKPRVVDHLKGRDTKDFQAAIHACGMVANFAKECVDYDISAVMRGIDSAEVKETAKQCRVAIAWLERLLKRLESS